MNDSTTNRHKRPVRGALVVALVFAFAAVSTFVMAEEHKMTICHVPPGNEENAHTINISANAWEAHEAHGDVEGECEDDAFDGPQGGGGKITICHFPPGNPDNAHTIEVSVNAWEAHHSQHNDTQGPCPVDDGNETVPDNETDEGPGNETEDRGEGDAPPAGDVDEGDGEAPPAGGVDECVGPQWIQAVAVGTSIHVTWDAVEDADRYLLWRSTGDSRFDPLVITEAGDTEHTDDTVEVGLTYSYHVTAMVGDAELGPCDTAEATAIPNFPTILGGALASILGIGAYAMARRRD